MYRYIMALLLLVLPVDAFAQQALRIVLFGDSLMAGPGLEQNQKVSGVLQQYLDYYKVQAQVLNAGVNGETTAGGLARVDSILQMKPDVVVLALGANDMLRQQDAKLAYDNLSRILQRLLADGKVKVMLAGMLARPSYTKAYQESFNSIYPLLAQQYAVEFFPFLLKDVAMVPEMNLQDGMHPNAKGAAKIAENMAPYLFRLLGYYAQENK